ncbi:MAG: FMN-binding protein [Treponema sp.]|nr:FMN-binding protein [Treponema sp.]
MKSKNIKPWEIVKLGLILMVYTAAACVGLAFVYAKTKAVIDKQETANLEAAIKELFPDADGFSDIKGTIPNHDSGVIFENEYRITLKNKLIGAAIQASGGGYGGPIKVLVGVKADGTISRIKIMSHSETPGLGANAEKANYFVDKSAGITFYDQFAGKVVADPFEPKNDIIAITASTITSRAISGIVRVVGRAAAQWLLSTEGAQP